MLKQFYWTRAAYFSKCTCSILGKLLFTLRCFWNIYTYLCNCVLLEPSRTERNRKDSTSSWTFFPCLLLVTINCSLHSSIYWGISLLSRSCYLELGAKDLKRQTAAHFPAQQNHYLQSRFLTAASTGMIETHGPGWCSGENKLAAFWRKQEGASPLVAAPSPKQGQFNLLHQGLAWLCKKGKDCPIYVVLLRYSQLKAICLRI